MKRQMYRVGLGVAVVLSLATVVGAADSASKSVGPDPQRVYTEAEAIQIGWPMMAGPLGNYQPLRTATPIVDDLAQMKILWTSEGLRLGTCKQGTGFGGVLGSGKRAEEYFAKSHPGAWGGLIVADGKVFAASFRPSGELVECEFPDKTKGKVPVNAEDFVVAVDFQTGKKLWETVEPGSILGGGGKRISHQVTPVYAQGKVFAMGGTGRVFAYDATTGKKLWQTDIGAEHQKREAARKQVLEAAASGKFLWAAMPSWNSSLLPAEDVLVVPTFAGDSFRGLEMATGKQLWEKSGLTFARATPSVFRSGGREYILSANMKGEMMLLDPQDGKELWKVTGLGVNGFTLSPSDKYVVVNVNPDAGKGKGKEGRIPCYFGAYRISPAKAELAWKMPFERKYGFAAWNDCLAGHQETIRDGRFYYWGVDVENRTFIVNVETGAVMAESEKTVGGQRWYLVGDKIVGRVDATHANIGDAPWEMWSVAGNKFTELPGKFNPKKIAGTYEVIQQTPLVAGRLFERTQTGEINCYDLRAPVK